MTSTPNLASFFVDSNVSDGRGDHVALIHDTGRTTYAELAEVVNRAGNVLTALGVSPGDRVLLALSDGIEFVAIWYGAQKIGAVTAEAYTFLTAKDYAYFVDYTAANVVIVDAVTLDPVREAVAASNGEPQLLVVGVPSDLLREGEHSFAVALDAASTELDAADRSTADVAIWKFTTGSTGAPKACVHPASSALASFDAYAKGVLSLTADDMVLAVPKLFFGYARDLVRAVPVRRGRHWDRVRRPHDTGGDLRPHRPSSTNHPRQRSNDDERDGRSPAGCGCRPVVSAPVHVGGRGPAARAPPSLG